MHIPEHFRASDAEALIERLARRSAGLLITIGGDGSLCAAHAPILWDASAKIARGHIARANPQWRQGAGKGLLVLSGAEAYISPGWYASKAEHGKAVPTWNYEAVHLTGAVGWFDKRERLEAVVRDLSALHEGGREQPWGLDDAPRDYIDAMLRGIVGFELRAEKVEAKRKLSQNKSGADIEGVLNGLEAEADVGAREMAALMRALRAGTSEA